MYQSIRLYGQILSGGGETRCCFQVSPGGKIVIGDDCGLSNIAITSRTSVTLGKHVRLGAGSRIYDTDFMN